MKIAVLLTVIPLSLISVGAIASMSTTEGDTNCIIISSLSKKKALEVPCSYTGNVGGSMSYSIEQMDYKLSTGPKYHTINDATFDFGKDGEIKNLVEKISVNGKSAKLKNLIDGTYKEISEADLEARYNEEPVNLAGILKCFIPDAKKDTAFCVPFSEEVEEDDMS